MSTSTDADRLIESATKIYRWASASTTGTGPPAEAVTVTAEEMMALAEALGVVIDECRRVLDYAEKAGPAFRLAQRVLTTLDGAL